MEKDERILVIGAGVNGCICARALWDAGVDVTLLARGPRLEFLKDQGVVIEDPYKGTRSVTKVPLIGTLDPDDVFDYVFAVVRKNQAIDLLPALAANKSPNVVFMVNNPSGPDEYVKALGEDRVMLGFVFGAGRKVGDVIHGISPKGLATPFGEIDGRRSERLARLVALLRRARLNACEEANMVDWQATHAALVAPFAALLMKHGNDNYRLAKSREDLKRLAVAMRETLDVLRATGHRIVPSGTEIFGRLPAAALAWLFGVFLAKRIAEIGGAWHCSQAPDEMRRIAQELEAMVERSGEPFSVLRGVLAEMPS